MKKLTCMSKPVKCDYYIYGQGMIPKWFKKAIEHGLIFMLYSNAVQVYTPNGNRICDFGDVIVRDDNNNLYVYNRNQFNNKFDIIGHAE